MKLRAKIRFERPLIFVIRPRQTYRHAIEKSGILGFQLIIDEYPNLTGTAFYVLQIYVVFLMNPNFYSFFFRKSIPKVQEKAK